MSIAASQSPPAASHPGADAAGERVSVPVLIRIPDLKPAPAKAHETETHKVETHRVEAQVGESFAAAAPLSEKPAAVEKAPFEQLVRRRPQKAERPPLALLAGVGLVTCLLVAMLLRKETPLDAVELEMLDVPGQIAADELSVEEHRLPYDPNEPINLRAEVPPPQAESEPTVMPWPRQSALPGTASLASGTEAPPSDNSPATGMYQPAFEARRPTAAAVEFEGTITKPEFRTHYERY